MCGSEHTLQMTLFCMLAGPCGQTEKVSFLQGDTWGGNLWQGNRKKDGQEDNCQEGGQSATGKTVGYFDKGVVSRRVVCAQLIRSLMFSSSFHETIPFLKFNSIKNNIF